jgi:hypothetical protein
VKFGVEIGRKYSHPRYAVSKSPITIVGSVGNFEVILDKFKIQRILHINNRSDFQTRMNPNNSNSNGNNRSRSVGLLSLCSAVIFGIIETFALEA